MKIPEAVVFGQKYAKLAVRFAYKSIRLCEITLKTAQYLRFKQEYIYEVGRWVRTTLAASRAIP